MDTIWDGREQDAPNLYNAHINAIGEGDVIVRLDYVPSQEDLERVRRGDATSECLYLRMSPRQAKTLAEGLRQMAAKIETHIGKPRASSH